MGRLVDRRWRRRVEGGLAGEHVAENWKIAAWERRLQGMSERYDCLQTVGEPDYYTSRAVKILGSCQEI